LLRGLLPLRRDLPIRDEQTSKLFNRQLKGATAGCLDQFAYHALDLRTRLRLRTLRFRTFTDLPGCLPTRSPCNTYQHWFRIVLPKLPTDRLRYRGTFPYLILTSFRRTLPRCCTRSVCMVAGWHAVLERIASSPARTVPRIVTTTDLAYSRPLNVCMRDAY